VLSTAPSNPQPLASINSDQALLKVTHAATGHAQPRIEPKQNSNSPTASGTQGHFIDQFHSMKLDLKDAHRPTNKELTMCLASRTLARK
jgi:hypothetical protein